MKIKSLIALIILAILALLAWQQMRINALQKSGQLDRIRLSMYEDSVTVLKDKNQNLTYKIQAVEVNHANVKQALVAAGYSIKDLRSREIKWRNLSAALQMKLEQAGSGSIALRDTVYASATDTVMAKYGVWKDRYLSLWPIVKADSMDFTYTYQTGIDVMVTPDGKNSVVNVFLTDPLDKTKSNEFGRIVSASSFVVKPTRHWYTSKWLYLGAGIVTGAIIAK
jgi:hypothetical protein